MRGPVKNRNMVKPDSVHGSLLISKMINYAMERGKKEVARRLIYGVLEDVKAELKVDNAAEIVDTIIRNVGPTMEVRSRRIGGATYQVPREVRPERRLSLALRWILDAAGNKKGAPMRKKLKEELVLAYKNEGEAIKKRENVHKMAEANRAFAHFAW